MNRKKPFTHPRRVAWWASAALILAAIAVALPVVARAIAGPPGARVHIRWQADLAQSEREALESQFRLTRREQLDTATWRYDLADTRTENIRALIDHPAVTDTHDIDRSRSAIAPGAVRTARGMRFGGGGNGVVALADLFAAVAAFAALLLAGLGIAGRAKTPDQAAALLERAPDRIRSVVKTAGLPIVRFLQRGIPVLDVRTAGMFRILFGTLAVLYFAIDPVDSSLLDAAFDVNVNGPVHAAVLEWLRGRRWLVDAVAPWLLVTGIAFTAGLFTRLSYALFVLGVLLWAYVAVYTDSTHPHSTLILALVALLPSRWGDAVSVDAWRGGSPWTRPISGSGAPDEGRPGLFGPGRMYGYSVWVPGLVFGIAFAAAAWAKLSGGLTWVATGAVKYHFITDAAHAPVNWGLQFVEYPRVSVLASLTAVTVEAMVITAAFVRSSVYRLVMGFFALTLLVGFWLFMGVFWPAWWLLLLGFLPWGWMGSGVGRVLSDAPIASAVLSRHATAAQLALILFVLGQQVVISALKTEWAPMFTYYPMYSASWPSIDAFNRSSPPVYRVFVSGADGRVELRCRPSERLVTEFRQAVAGSTAAVASVTRQLEDCAGNLAPGEAVMFEEYRSVFDTGRRAFTMTPTAAILGPLPLRTGE